jgi:hypothetical protein
MMASLLFLLVFQISLAIGNEVSNSDNVEIMTIFNETIKPLSRIIELTNRQPRNRASVPQSLTLLMNFKTDGTTSFQIMQGKPVSTRQHIHLDSTAPSLFASSQSMIILRRKPSGVFGQRLL